LQAAEKLLLKEELEKYRQSEDTAAEKAQRDKADTDTMYVHTYVHDEDEVMMIMTATMVV
jgi:thiamine pyrophosphokinase